MYSSCGLAGVCIDSFMYLVAKKSPKTSQKVDIQYFMLCVCHQKNSSKNALGNFLLFFPYFFVL